MTGRQLHRLSALRVAKEVEPGHYADGGGLYMQIADSGARSWVFRFKINGRVREVGLGPLSRVSLGEARKLTAGYREMVRNQTDPIFARREQQRRQLLDISADANVTFREAAESYIRAREPEWRNSKHVQQWGNTLKRYAYPVIGAVRVRDIDTAMIVRILQPIWTKKAETARRVRGRIKAILDAETVVGHRTGSNPARYVDHLQLVLPRSKKRSQVKHHPALPGKNCRRSSGNLSNVPGVRHAYCTCLSSLQPAQTRCALRAQRSSTWTIVSGQFPATVRKVAGRFACRFVSGPSRSCVAHYPRRNKGICSRAARKGDHCRTWQC